MDLDVSSNLKHDCFERHFGFHWAATHVETGLDAFNENLARGPSLLARWRPAAFRHFAVEAAGCAVRALDTSRFV